MKKLLTALLGLTLLVGGLLGFQYVTFQHARTEVLAQIHDFEQEHDVKLDFAKLEIQGSILPEYAVIEQPRLSLERNGVLYAAAANKGTVTVGGASYRAEIQEMQLSLRGDLDQFPILSDDATIKLEGSQVLQGDLTEKTLHYAVNQLVVSDLDNEAAFLLGAFELTIRNFLEESQSFTWSTHSEYIPTRGSYDIADYATNVSMSASSLINAMWRHHFPEWEALMDGSGDFTLSESKGWSIISEYRQSVRSHDGTVYPLAHGKISLGASVETNKLRGSFEDKRQLLVSSDWRRRYLAYIEEMLQNRDFAAAFLRDLNERLGETMPLFLKQSVRRLHDQADQWVEWTDRVLPHHHMEMRTAGRIDMNLEEEQGVLQLTEFSLEGDRAGIRLGGELQLREPMAGHLTIALDGEQGFQSTIDEFVAGSLQAMELLAEVSEPETRNMIIMQAALIPLYKQPVMRFLERLSTASDEKNLELQLELGENLVRVGEHDLEELPALWFETLTADDGPTEAEEATEDSSS